MKREKPQDQTNEKIYDLVVIGTGQTGMTLVNHLLKYNKHILLIDKNNPAIKSSLDIKLFTILANKYKGIETSKFMSFFYKELIELKEKYNKVFHEEAVIHANVNIVKGAFEILSHDQIKVNGEKYKFKKLVFANGSHYEDLNLPNISKDMYIKPTELNKLNSSIEIVAIYGSDWIALELGQALTKVGVMVYFVDYNVNPFHDFDDEIESVLKKQFKNDLMSWCLGAEVINHQFIEDNLIKITIKSDEKEYSIVVNKIIAANTNVANTQNIKSHSEIYKNSQGAIVIDSSFVLKNHRNFYAIGDVNGIHMYPNQGTYQASILAKNLLGAKEQFDIYNFGFSLKIDPSISFYGMNKNQIEYLQIPYNEFIYEFKDFDKNQNQKEIARIKVFTNKKHEILGVLLIGDKLSELISLFILAKQNKTKLYELSSLNLPFFSKAELIKKAAWEYYYEFAASKKNKGLKE